MLRKTHFLRILNSKALILQQPRICVLLSALNLLRSFLFSARAALRVLRAAAIWLIRTARINRLCVLPFTAVLIISVASFLLLPQVVLLKQKSFRAVVVVVLRPAWYEPIPIKETGSLLRCRTRQYWLAKVIVPLVQTNQQTRFVLSEGAWLLALLHRCKAVRRLFSHLDALDHDLPQLKVPYSALSGVEYALIACYWSSQGRVHLTVGVHLDVKSKVALMLLFARKYGVFLLFVCRKSQLLLKGPAIIRQMQNIFPEFPTTAHLLLLCRVEACFPIETWRLESAFTTSIRRGSQA